MRPQGNDTLATIHNMEKLRPIERGASWIQLSLMDKVRGTRDVWTQRACVVAHRRLLASACAVRPVCST